MGGNYSIVRARKTRQCLRRVDHEDALAVAPEPARRTDNHRESPTSRTDQAPNAAASIAHDCRLVVSASAVNGLMICSRSTSPTTSSGTSARGGYWAGGAGFVASITMAVIGRAALVPS